MSGQSVNNGANKRYKNSNNSLQTHNYYTSFHLVMQFFPDSATDALTHSRPEEMHGVSGHRFAQPRPEKNSRGFHCGSGDRQRMRSNCPAWGSHTCRYNFSCFPRLCIPWGISLCRVVMCAAGTADSVKAALPQYRDVEKVMSLRLFKNVHPP